MNNDLFLLIRTVKMPQRLPQPKQKKQAVFHKKHCSQKETLSDYQIMERYCRKYIKLDIGYHQLMDIVLRDEFIDCNVSFRIRTLKLSQSKSNQLMKCIL